jgi:hypothetical protein
VVVLDQRPDVWSNRRAIKAHHEQLTLIRCQLIPSRQLDGSDPPSSCIMGTLARPLVTLRILWMNESVRMRCSPIEIVPYGIHFLDLAHDDDNARLVGCDVRSPRLNVPRRSLMVDERWGEMAP